jgi:hypothetical protein
VGQVTPDTVAMSTSAQLNIKKAVTVAQRKGMGYLKYTTSLRQLSSSLAGHNHPLRIGTGVAKDQTTSASSAHMSMAHHPWPKRSSVANQRQESHINRTQETSGGSLRPIILPKFVLSPESVRETGYQEAHKLYDEMRRFFARKASAEHQNEVVVIKFTMMSLRPGYRNPQVVSVRQPLFNQQCDAYLVHRTSRKRSQIFHFILALWI